MNEIGDKDLGARKDEPVFDSAPADASPNAASANEATSAAASSASSEPTKAASDPSPVAIEDAQSRAITVLPPLGKASDDIRIDGAASGKSADGGSTTRMFLKAAAILVVLGGASALATTGIAHLGGDKAATATENANLKQTVARLDSEITSLRASLDQAVKTNAAQSTRVTERIDRVEKAQAEPAARLAKLSDAVERLSKPAVQTAAATTTTTAASSDVTGSIPAAAHEPKKPPILEGWTVRNVSDGGALVQGPFGLFDVFPGDPLPGLNRVEAIRREGGRWVVVTRKGWIVAR